MDRWSLRATLPGDRPQNMEKRWLTLSEAFECIGKHLFPDDWTADEIDWNPLRLNMPASKMVESKPKSKQHRCSALERHKMAFIKLLEMMFSGQTEAKLVFPGGSEKKITASLWPDPQNWYRDETEEDGNRKAQFKRFWFDIPSGLAKIHPGPEALSPRYKNTPHWYDYIGDVGEIEIDNGTFQSALPKQSHKQHPKKRGPRKGTREIDDRESLKEMRNLVDKGKSRWAAACLVAPTANGTGTEDSNARRLYIKYKIVSGYN
jgi:hypothetical protein